MDYQHHVTYYALISLMCLSFFMGMVILTVWWKWDSQKIYDVLSSLILNFLHKTRFRKTAAIVKIFFGISDVNPSDPADMDVDMDDFGNGEETPTGDPWDSEYKFTWTYPHSKLVRYHLFGNCAGQNNVLKSTGTRQTYHVRTHCYRKLKHQLQ